MASNDTSIKFYRFDNLNAPQLDNAWGLMTTVLDACLVNGFGDQLVTAIDILDGVGTAVFANVHNLLQYQVVEFSGTGVTELHREFKVLGITGNTIQFLVDLPDQSIVGSIICRLPSLGWSRPFTDTNKRVYRAKDIDTNPYYLRVDDSLAEGYNTTYAKFAKVGILETCGSIDDTGGVQTPWDPVNPNKNWVTTGTGTSVINGWMKWYYAIYAQAATDRGYAYDFTAPAIGTRIWILIGTADSFYIINGAGEQQVGGMAIPFGFFAKKINEVSYPYLAACAAFGAATAQRNYTTGLSLYKTAMLCNMYNNNATLANTSFSSTYPSIGETSSGINSDFTIATGSDGIMIGDMYVMDSNRYLIMTPPLVKMSPNNCTKLSNYSFHQLENDILIAVEYRDRSGGTLGKLFFKVYEGDPL